MSVARYEKWSKARADEELKRYLNAGHIVIVDSVSRARVSLAANLANLGATRQKMSLCGDIAEARREIQAHKPKLILADFMIGGQSGLDLLQEQKIIYENESIKDNLFLLVTGNASQSTVARAAEEDVDNFVIKPYSLDTLKKSLLVSLELKLNPSEYLQKIDEGKAALFEGRYDEALVIFNSAKGLHKTPTLACFYLGQTEVMKEALEGAKKDYQDGLDYNKIHYKCLVGLFELLWSQRKLQDAYDVVKRLAQYFPANPNRLSTVLKLSVMTDSFDDMEGYYRIFVKMDERTEELIKYMCSALVVTGKHYLRRKLKARAIEVFENAAVSAAGRSQFLEYIIETLVDFSMVEEARRFFDRLVKTSPASKAALTTRFLIATLEESPEMAVQIGRQTINEGAITPAVYEKFIVVLVKARQLEAAEDYYQRALKTWPDRAKGFTEIWESLNPASHAG